MEASEETKGGKRTDINLECRYYENKYPNEGDYVKVWIRFSESLDGLTFWTIKVKVKEVVDNGAYVSLLEYNNIEGSLSISSIPWLNGWIGMITTSEFTTARMKNITKVIKEGKQETVIVLRVDKEKGTDYSYSGSMFADIGLYVTFD